MHVGGHRFQRLAVQALGIDFCQLQKYGNAGRVLARCLAQYFLGLQVAAVGQVHIGFGHRVHFAAGVELAVRIGL